MMSWNNLFDNLKGEVQDKSKNPFFGAFIFTWFVRHWDLFFIIFYLDSDLNLDQKILKIQSYFNDLPKYDFWISIGITFLVIVLGYMFLNLARIISNFSEKIITPLIYKWTAGKVTIVLREDYDKVLLREERLKEKLIEEKEENELLEGQIEKLELKIKESLSNNIIDNNSPDTGSVFSDKPVEIVNSELKNDEIKKLNLTYKKLKKENLIDEFIKSASEILSGIPLSKFDEDISKFVSLKLIGFRQDENANHGTATFNLTDLGNNLLDKINYEEEHTL